MTEVLPKNSFPERMKAVIALAGNKEKLATAVSVSDVSISAVMLGKYESGQSEPSREKLVAIAQTAGVSVEWLATGEGPMRRGEGGAVGEPGTQWRSMGHLDLKPDNLGKAGRRQDDRYCYIPLYDVKASAGTGAVVDRESVVDFLSFKTEWIRNNLNATPTDLYLIHVEGESMEPTLRPGDVILVDHREAEKLPRDGVYVVRMDDSLLVKRLQRMPGAQVRVTSDNQAYQPFTVSLSERDHEFDIVGRVVWCGRRM